MARYSFVKGKCNPLAISIMYALSLSPALAEASKIPPPPYKGPADIASESSSAKKTTHLYFFALPLSPTNTSQRYLAALRVADTGRSASVFGCDGATYFLSKDDAAAVNAAVSSHDLVQLVTAPKGTKDPPVLCSFPHK